MPFPDPRLKVISFLGITGRIGDGKTTLYHAIREAGLPCHDLSMAAPLKEAAAVLFGGSKANYCGTQEERLQIHEFWRDRLGPEWENGRKQLQNLGDGLRKLISPWLWVYIAEFRILRELELGLILPGEVMIVPDVRYDNEATAIRMLGGQVIKIENTNRVVPSAEVNNAPSEAGISPELVDEIYQSGSHAATVNFGRLVAARYA